MKQPDLSVVIVSDRQAELGKAVGALLREVQRRSPEDAAAWWKSWFSRYPRSELQEMAVEFRSGGFTSGDRSHGSGERPLGRSFGSLDRASATAFVTIDGRVLDVRRDAGRSAHRLDGGEAIRPGDGAARAPARALGLRDTRRRGGGPGRAGDRHLPQDSPLRCRFAR